MNHELQTRLTEVLERPHRLGMIGGAIEEQLAHCASFSRVLGEARARQGAASGLALDLGSGGGVPGIPLAADHNDLEWILVEIRTARATELERCLLRLGLTATVDDRPAQELGHRDELRESAQVVVARSFGPPPFTAECATGLLRVGGVVVVSEPPEASLEDRWPSDALARLGFAAAVRHEDAGHQFVVIEKITPISATLPRLPPRADRGWY